MPSQIYLHDIGRKVDVDDTFFEMDEAQQGQYIHGIVQQYNSMNPSVIENLRAGTSRVGQGIQNTLKKERSGSDVLDFIGGAVKAGTDIVGGTPETNRALDPNNPFAMPTITDVAADPIKNLPNWAAGAVGDALPTMAAATVAASPLGRFGAAAQAVGGMGAATLLSGITDFGSTADSIANRNGRQVPNDDDYNEAIAVTGATALFDGVASYYGIKSGAAKNLVLGAVSTGGTVGLQKVAATGELPNAEELLDSTLRGAVGAEGAARGIRAVQNIGPAVQKYQVGGEYSNNPDQVMSDARVGKLFQGRSGAEKQFDRGWDVNADETFKGIKADIKSHLEDLTDVSRRAGDIDTDQAKALKEITQRAAKHNHSLAEGGMDHAYFQTEIDAVRQMGLPPHTERAYINALRDLETVSYNSMKKNAKGPAERALNSGISKGVGGAIGMTLGSSVGGPTGAWVGAGIGGLIPGRIGRAVDTMTGSRQPPVLRRIEARNAYLKGKNIDPGDTVSQLQSAITDAQGRVKVVRPAAPRQGSPLSSRLNAAGTPRIGGWQKAIIDNVNEALGYRVVGTKELHDTIDEAVQLGDLTSEEATALKSRGNNEVDSQLMYDLSDIMAEKYGKGLSQDVPTTRTGDQAEPRATEGSGIRNEYAYRQTMANVKSATQAALDGAGTPEMRSSIAEIANARTPAEKKALLSKLLAENPEQADFINKQVGPITDYGPKDKPSSGPKMMSGIDPMDVKEKLFDPAVAGVKSMAKTVSDALGLSSNDLTPGEGVTPGNTIGIAAKYRVKIERPVDVVEQAPKGVMTLKTNTGNADKNLRGVDFILKRFPNATKSAKEWATMIGSAFGTNEPEVPPYGLIKHINEPQHDIKLLNSLTKGQLDDADHGFEQARAFRKAYKEGRAGVRTTASMFLWSFLSRGVSPFVQESMFIDGVEGAYPFIDKAVKEGRFDADEKVDLGDGKNMSWNEWTKTVAPAGSGQPGSGTQHNLNAFGHTFLKKMAEKVPGTDKSGLQHLNDMIASDMTGPEIRREFLKAFEGVGIDMKVLSFSLLVTGRDDVMVLDRVQVRRNWNDGRFGDENLYDVDMDGDKQLTGTSLSTITYGARGLLVYEAMERGLTDHVKKVYKAVGREKDASIGRYHWETWVGDAGQEASHGSLGGILSAAEGKPNPYAESFAKEGQYDTYNYGAEYSRGSDNTPKVRYPLPTGETVVMTIPDFTAFKKEVSNAKSGVVPKGFKVSDATSEPWYLNKAVDKARLRELAYKFSKR